MSIPGRITAFLTLLNTHKIGWLGLILAIASLGLIGGKDDIDSWCAIHLDGFAHIARAYVNGSVTVAMVVVWPAIVAAWLGRPPTVPGKPK